MIKHSKSWLYNIHEHTNTIHIQTDDMLMLRLHVASSPFSWNFLKHGVMHSPTKHDEHWYLDRFCFVAVEQKRHLLKLDNLSGRWDPTSLNLISSGTPRGRPCFAYLFFMSCVFSCTWSSHAEYCPNIEWLGCRRCEGPEETWGEGKFC